MKISLSIGKLLNFTLLVKKLNLSLENFILGQHFVLIVNLSESIALTTECPIFDFI